MNDTAGSIVGILVFVLIVIGIIWLYLFRTRLEKKTSLTRDASLFKLVNANKQLDRAEKSRPGRQIFINYRRSDSSGYALALYNELLKWYDKRDIFKDFHNIEPGEDFELAIDGALDRCNVLIVIIADKWGELIKERSKLKDTDYVNMEIAAALAKNVYVIPVTINGAGIPNETDLPDALKKLTRRQSLNIDQTRFENDVLKLVNVLDKRFGIDRHK